MLKAKYTTGSSLLLNNPRDIDEVWFYETKEECDKARVTRGLGEKDINVHYSYVGREPMVFLGCYSYHYMKLIEGEDLHLDEFNIFDHEEEYKELLKRYASWLPQESKRWYHIITAYYLFKNKSYDLTEAQLKVIQSTHDKGITNAKYNLCIEWLDMVS